MIQANIAQEPVDAAGTGLRTGSSVTRVGVATGAADIAEERRASDSGFPPDLRIVAHGDAAHGPASAVTDERRARSAAGE